MPKHFFVQLSAAQQAVERLHGIVSSTTPESMRTAAVGACDMLGRLLENVADHEVQAQQREAAWAEDLVSMRKQLATAQAQFMSVAVSAVRMLDYPDDRKMATACGQAALDAITKTDTSALHEYETRILLRLANRFQEAEGTYAAASIAQYLVDLAEDKRSGVAAKRVADRLMNRPVANEVPLPPSI